MNCGEAMNEALKLVPRKGVPSGFFPLFADGALPLFADVLTKTTYSEAIIEPGHEREFIHHFCRILRREKIPDKEYTSLARYLSRPKLN